MSKKQSKVEVMNIRFDLPPPSETNKVEPKQLSKTVKNFHKTEFLSSLRVIKHIKPKDIVFVNMPGPSNMPNRLMNSYQMEFSQFKNEKKMNVFNSSEKR